MINRIRLSLAASILVLSAFPVVRAYSQTDGAALMAKLRVFKFGTDRTTLDAVEKWVNESRANALTRRQAAEQLAGILKSDAAFDAKQFACRQLVLIASNEQIPALLPLLKDDALSQYALLVLARIPGNAVNQALLANYKTTSLPVKLEILDILGDRKVVTAIPLMKSALGQQDSTERAAFALAKTGSPEAAAILTDAYAKAVDKRREDIGQALLFYADKAPLRNSQVRDIYSLIDKTAALSSMRAAALRGFVRCDGVRALPAILTALKEDKSVRQSMASDLAARLPGGSATTLKLSAVLPKLSSTGRIRLLTALMIRNDPAAVPGIIPYLSDGQPAVRTAAIAALGEIGGVKAIPALLQCASAGSKDNRDAALSALGQLKGATIDAVLMRTLANAPDSRKDVAILALGQRNAAQAVPAMMRIVKTASSKTRAAALKVLREMGHSSDLPALIDTMMALPSDNRDEVMDAIAEIARRGNTESERTSTISNCLAKAAKVEDRACLLYLLGEIGGPTALQALQSAVNDPSPDLRLNALQRLSDWATDEPMQTLWNVVKSTTDERQRAMALRGYLRMIGMNDQRTPDQAVSLFRDALTASNNLQDKKLALSGLAKFKSLATLEFAASFLTTPELKAEAETAVVELAQGTAGAWPEKTKELIEPIAQNGENENARKAASTLLATMEKFGDFVMSWEVTPSYNQPGATYKELFDIPFGPELPTANTVQWRLMPTGTNAEQPWLLDLLALWGGEQRVAYLRNNVQSDIEQDAVMEAGSDDGIKVWLNGTVVFADNTQRAVAPGQEKIKLHLASGNNTLMLKITQNVMGWGACVLFTTPEGAPATGLHFTIPAMSDPTLK